MRRANDNKATEEQLKAQILLKKEMMRKLQKQKEEVPDIEGDEGYPRIYQMSSLEVHQKKLKENEFIKAELHKQVTSKNQQAQQL